MVFLLFSEVNIQNRIRLYMRGRKPIGSILSILCTLLLSVLPLYGNAQTYQTDSGHAEFTGHTPLFSFEGASDNLRGIVNLADSTVNFQLSVKTLDTGNDKRDRDMMNVLETDKYPNATFEGEITSSVNPEKSGEQEVTVKGTFTVHGTSQTLEIPGTMQFEGKKLNVAASWELKLTNYNMEPPRVLFYSMNDQIEIRIEASLEPITTSS